MVAVSRRALNDRGDHGQKPHRALGAKRGALAYVVPLDEDATAPNKLTSEIPIAFVSPSSVISVTLLNTTTYVESPVKLRAWRLVACGNTLVQIAPRRL